MNLKKQRTEVEQDLKNWMKWVKANVRKND